MQIQTVIPWFAMKRNLDGLDLVSQMKYMERNFDGLDFVDQMKYME